MTPIKDNVKISGDSSCNNEDDDSRTLADKIATFEYIDDTDVDADDDLAWSPFEKKDNLLSTPKRRPQKSPTSNTSSPVQSEFDVWNPQSQKSGEGGFSDFELRRLLFDCHMEN